MNDKLKLGIAAALILGVAGLSVITQGAGNDYYAITSGFSNIQQTNPDSNVADISMLVNYVPITGSATYTLTKVPMTVSINLSQPTNINKKIASAIKDQGASMGYNVLKVLLPQYNIVNP